MKTEFHRVTYVSAIITLSQEDIAVAHIAANGQEVDVSDALEDSGFTGNLTVTSRTAYKEE